MNNVILAPTDGKRSKKAINLRIISEKGVRVQTTNSGGCFQMQYQIITFDLSNANTFNKMCDAFSVDSFKK